MAKIENNIQTDLPVIRNNPTIQIPAKQSEVLNPKEDKTEVLFLSLAGLATVGIVTVIAGKKGCLGKGFQKFLNGAEKAKPELQKEAEKEIAKPLVNTNIMDAIPPELKVEIPWDKVPEMHKKYLKKYNELFYEGMTEVRKAKNFDETAKALEKYLATVGNNQTWNCVNISHTHAARLSQAVMAERSLQDTNVLMAIGSGLPSKVEHGIEVTVWNQGSHEDFLKEFKIKDYWKQTLDISELTNDLKKAGDGSIAFVAPCENHIILALNLKDNIFFIDNAMEQSAVVKSTKMMEEELYEKINGGMNSIIERNNDSIDREISNLRVSCLNRLNSFRTKFKADFKEEQASSIPEYLQKRKELSAQKINTKIAPDNASFNFTSLNEELTQKNAANQIANSYKLGYGISEEKVHDWLRGL